MSEMKVIIGHYRQRPLSPQKRKSSRAVSMSVMCHEATFERSATTISHGIFNQETHLYSRETFKQNRVAALAEWRQLCAA